MGPPAGRWIGAVPPRLRGSIAAVTVLLYTKPGCPYCAAARDHLSQGEEAFQERDATADPAWKTELMHHTKGTGVVPTLVRAEDDSVIQVGFPPGRG